VPRLLRPLLQRLVLVILMREAGALVASIEVVVSLAKAILRPEQLAKPRSCKSLILMATASSMIAKGRSLRLLESSVAHNAPQSVVPVDLVALMAPKLVDSLQSIDPYQRLLLAAI
jgi:hypothetical protein